MRLYELAGAYAAVQARAEQGEDVLDALAEIEDSIEAKAAALTRLMRDMQLDCDKLAEEIGRLTDRKRALANNCERLKTYLRTNMESCGLTSIKAGTFSVSLSDGPERVEVLDEAAIPPEYFRVKREVDKAAILTTHKANGECVPGVNVVRSKCLRVR